MSSPEISTRQTRTDGMVRAALDIVDVGGLDSLTMRRLADSLGVKLPTIYRHFINKQALLDGMADEILAGAVSPDGADVPWKERTIQLATDLRNTLLEQRDGARIVGGSYSATQHTLAFADAFIHTMQRAGFDGAEALWATATVFSYVLGESLEREGSSAEGMATLRATTERTEFPHLFSTPMDEFVNFEERFSFGLDVVVTGLAHRRAADPRT